MRLICAVTSLALCVLTSQAMAAEADNTAGSNTAESNAPTQEYLDQKAELAKMTESRDLDLYEMSFEPLHFDRIVVTTRTNQSVVFNYLTFRLRNEVADKTSSLLSKAPGYNDVLAAIQEQYAGQVHKVEDNGVKLQVEGVEGKDGTIVERQDSQIHQKKVSLTVYGYDEHGSRLRLLDEPPGSGPQESFNFPDLGATSWSAAASMVKDRVEEKEGRELFSLDKIRSMELPPYSATDRQPNGWAKGELYGVAIFHRLSDYGNHFTFQIRGLSNKFRIHWPDADPGSVENYLNARFFRRMYVLHYDRSGDEYFRELDPFTLVKGGWEWVNTFQRLEQRRSEAYARFFLNNIQNEKDGKPNDAVEAEFWPYYAKVREAHPKRIDQLPDLEQTVKTPAK